MENSTTLNSRSIAAGIVAASLARVRAAERTGNLDDTILARFKQPEDGGPVSRPEKKVSSAADHWRNYRQWIGRPCAADDGQHEWQKKGRVNGRKVLRCKKCKRQYCEDHVSAPEPKVASEIDFHGAPKWGEEECTSSKDSKHRFYLHGATSAGKRVLRCYGCKRSFTEGRR